MMMMMIVVIVVVVVVVAFIDNAIARYAYLSMPIPQISVSLLLPPLLLLLLPPPPPTPAGLTWVT